MISKLSIVQYRKLKGLELNFRPGVNIISGTNGTCKSSVLHMISNAYKKVPRRRNARVSDAACVTTIMRNNTGVNCKIEALVKGDKKYRDPAIGVTGNLFSIAYENGCVLNFRRHNASQGSRFAVKPKYARGSHEQLPELPVIYLGLPRLLPRGELSDTVSTKKVSKYLPEKYKKELVRIYKDLTGIEMGSECAISNVASLKCCEEFETQVPGIDSNTISSGEDNLLCILRALLSLSYYYESLQIKTGFSESVLLVDELDATLHPSLQIKVCELFRHYSREYKIQVVCTTHSITLVEDALAKNDNVLYFVDDVNHISIMGDPDVFKIRMHLRNCARADLYAGRKIPIFSEDEEARDVLSVLLDYIIGGDVQIRHLRPHFHMIEACLGADHIKNVFKDECLSLKRLAFAVLDGDKGPDEGHNLLVLPGGASPEQFLYAYGKMLYGGQSDEFWHSTSAMENGYTRRWFEQIINKWDAIEHEIEGIHAQGGHTTGIRRKRTKAIWGEFRDFFMELMRCWVQDPANASQIDIFRESLKKMYTKTATANGLNANDWK